MLVCRVEFVEYRSISSAFHKSIKYIANHLHILGVKSNHAIPHDYADGVAPFGVTVNPLVNGGERSLGLLPQLLVGESVLDAHYEGQEVIGEVHDRPVLHRDERHLVFQQVVGQKFLQVGAVSSPSKAVSGVYQQMCHSSLCNPLERLSKTLLILLPSLRPLLLQPPLEPPVDSGGLDSFIAERIQF